MPSPGPDTEELEPFQVIWIAKRALLSVAVGLPAIIVSAALFGLVMSGFFSLSITVFSASLVAALIVGARLTTWLAYGARRVVAVSDSSLMVRRGAKTVMTMPWTDIASVDLRRGDSLARIVLDITADGSDFPSIRATPTDVWDTRGSFPGLLAIFPEE